MGSERRGRAVQGRLEVNPSGEEPTDRPKQKNAGLWEPYDGRLSRTVLREREGEVPSRHSPGQPGGRCGWVQCRAMRRRCQRNSVSGVTSHPARLGRASAAAIAPSKLRSVSVSSGRSICRRSTASWWRKTMISRSLERPDRTVSRASDARNRYKIRYTRNQDWLSSLQVNAHDRVFGTHRIGRSVAGRRTFVAIEGGHRYRFVTDSAFAFLNFRRDTSAVVLRPGTPAHLETADVMGVPPVREASP